MKRIFGTMLLMLLMAVGAHKASAQEVSGYGVIKANIRMDLGIDVGITLADRFAVQVGMMSDINRPMGEEHEILQEYKEAVGSKYRLSYTAGPAVKLADWLWLGASVGYGEYGVYGYSDRLEMYGISGKVKGLEAGGQLRFILGMYSLQLGYSTIPKGFSLNKPFHDISFGVGMNF